MTTGTTLAERGEERAEPSVKTGGRQPLATLADPRGCLCDDTITDKFAEDIAALARLQMGHGHT